MKTIIPIFAILLLFGCSWKDIKNDVNLMNIKGVVTYWKWECSPIWQKIGKEKWLLFTGKIIFLKKSELQELNKKMGAFVLPPQWAPTFQDYYEDLYTQIKEKSPTTYVYNWIYNIDISPWEYRVITDKNESLNLTAVFPKWTVALWKNFNFYECENTH